MTATINQHGMHPDHDEAPERVRLAVSANTKKALLAILAALDVEATGEAIRLLTEAISQGLIPQRVPLGQWLTEAIGSRMAGRLVEGFATRPCFYCEHGHTLCQDCDGRGRNEDGRICGRCVGLGREFCEFCNGSGLLAIDTVPPDLRLAVVLARVRQVAKTLDALLRQPLPSVRNSAPREAASACAKLLFALNRNLGVLENAAVAVMGFSTAQSPLADTGARITKTCVKAGVRLERRIRRILCRMAGIARRWAKEASSPAVRQASMQRAAHYLQVVRERLVRTPLEHPRLLHGSNP